MTLALNFLAAAEKILTDSGQPMHYREITQTALSHGYLQTQGKTPSSSLNAQVSVEIKKHGERSTFVRTGPGVFGLRRWLEDGGLNPETLASNTRTMVPHYPSYHQVRDVLPVWAGAPDGAITRMQNATGSHSGTPQEQVDWSDPDLWIDERLEGESREWALRTWEGSAKRVSPRYVTGHWLLIRNYGLLETDASGHLRLTAAGKDFLAAPNGDTVRRIDLDQGLLLILRLVAEAGTATPSNLLNAWSEFLRSETKVRAVYVAKVYLSQRLKNLLQRGHVERSGWSYGISEKGLRYLESATSQLDDSEPEDDLESEIRRLQEELRQQVREGIKAQLMEMDPYAFEELVQRLLDAMGYQDTQTTTPSSDGGVDVLGTIKVGISEIKEVVQVKRQKQNVGRPVLDGLRGSLYRFDAVQGTVITTSGFTRDARAVAFDRGAAPITLIDGDTLVGLLIEHEIGVKKRKIELWSLDPEPFVGGEEKDGS